MAECTGPELCRHRIRKPSFPTVHTNTINLRFLKTTVFRAFQAPSYLWPKTPFACGREVQKDKKIAVFENIRIRVEGALVLDFRK